MVIATLLVLLSSASAGWEPASWPPPAPGVSAAPAPAPQDQSLLGILYHWYHVHVSSQDGARCPYYPTCSAYGLTAWRTRGPVVGSMLVVDRLLREYPWMDHFHHYPVITPHGTPRLHDPVPPP